jgi:hypothetical protein
LPKWIEHGDWGGVSCTARTFASAADDLISRGVDVTEEASAAAGRSMADVKQVVVSRA